MNFLTYPLRDGYVANWLVAGPVVSPVPPGWDDSPGIEGAPIERGPIGTGGYQVGEHTGVWAYHACPEDNFVDHSGYYTLGHYLRSWACTELVSDTTQNVALEVTAFGPTGVWIDGVLRLQLEGGSGHSRVELRQGASRVIVRFERTSDGETTHVVALGIHAEDVSVQIPTLIGNVGRRWAFEQLTAGAFVERDVYQGGTPVVLRWPEGKRAFCPAHVRLQTADDAMYALADVAGAPGDSVELGYALQLPAGPMRVTLMPSPDEVYLQHTRIERRLPLWSMGRQRYVATPAAGDLESRRREALLAVAEYADSPFAQIARLALGTGDAVQLCAADELDEALLLTLVGSVIRFGPRPEIEAAVLGYNRWAASGDEASRILRHAAEVLAGQRSPDRLFADGQTGAWHCARGEQLVLEWTGRFASLGSAQPGTPHVIEQEVVALSHLADLAESPVVYEMAAVCLDKLLFTLAFQSREGVLGSASRRFAASCVKSGLLQPTTPINRLLWGTGIYNHHLAGVLSLACATGYEPPPVLEAIARDTAGELWSRERHAPCSSETSIVTFKTPDYILSSLANVEPGVDGAYESTWRATLGPEAVVFANQPGSSSESDSRAPGFWSGNARLPRVGQWRDALVALHHVKDNDRLPFTHAYFPCVAFDEYVLRDGWAFARLGDAYLALTNSAGMSLTVEGPYAFRELRAYGGTQAWLVQMGRAMLDTDLAAFQSRVLGATFEVDALRVQWTTMRGDDLHLEWGGAFNANHKAQSSPDWLHFDNAYTTTDLPCRGMDIRIGEEVLRLDFGTP